MLELFAVADDAGLNHFADQVVSFAGTLAHSGKYRQTAVAFCDVVDQFLDQNGFAYTGTAEQTNFTPLSVGLNQVNYLDAGQQDFRGGR